MTVIKVSFWNDKKRRGSRKREKLSCLDDVQMVWQVNAKRNPEGY